MIHTFVQRVQHLRALLIYGQVGTLVPLTTRDCRAWYIVDGEKCSMCMEFEVSAPILCSHA
jgi:hypothetical protein